MTSWLGIAIISVTLLVSVLTNSANQDKFQTVDVAKLASHAYGTELILLENSYKEEKSYRFEDFFWTGSGDGSSDEDDLWDTEKTPTVYKTKTVTSTLYMETPPTSYNMTNPENTTKCTFNCDAPSSPSGEINPSPTLNPNEDKTITEAEDDEFFDADRQFWLLTVLKSDGKDPVIIDLKNSLAKLYKTAFQRQQERHLGIRNRRKKRDMIRDDNIKRNITEKPVKVYIHNVEKSKTNGDDEKIQVLYHVTVSGKPVAAITAAEDMTLVTDAEVREELGYPFFIKAEPYLKAAEPQGLSRARNTWIFIGVSLLVLLALLLIVAFITLGFTKCQKIPTETAAGIDNRRQIFERGVGTENNAFVYESSDKIREESPTYINFKSQPSNQTLRSGTVMDRQSYSSSSSSSSASLDISPLMGLKKQRTPPKKPPRPKAALNKTAPLAVKKIAPELFDTDSNGSNSPDTIVAGNFDSRVVSPKSYLSMPSVKSFPRGNMPEPLNKVLEPVSVLHLDMPDDEMPGAYNEQNFKPNLIRYGSVGTVEDPGVIGPIVWNMHCQRLQHGVSVDEGINDLKTTKQVSKMRKRFHDLLDDTFSLFGSRRESPVDNYNDPKPIPVIETKSHSAANTRADEEIRPIIRPRPKTTDLRKVVQSPSSGGPKGAWASTAPSPLIRPLSAGPVMRPKVNVDLVLAEGKFRANDPAVPLIAAIKNEIEKCSLPGSTTDLQQ